MFAGLRQRLTYANVIATLALFVALGGGAYAAIRIPANSVGSKQLRNNAVSSSKVKDRSLLAKDFKNGQLPTGPRGFTGGPGTPGKAGSDASSILVGRLDTLADFGLALSSGYTDGVAYLYPQGATAGQGLKTEAEATELSPARAVVARDLFVKEDHVSANAIGTRNYILRVNGQDSALRCSTTAGHSNPGGTIQCSDTTHGVTIPPGSIICLKAEQNYYTGGGFSDTIPVRFGWRAASS
jgi:hypothetical protein